MIQVKYIRSFAPHASLDVKVVAGFGISLLDGPFPCVFSGVLHNKVHFFSYIGHKNNLNSIMLPHHQIDSTLSTNMTNLTCVSCQPADDVCLYADSESDWLIIQKFCSTIEGIFLKQHCLVYSDQILFIKVNNSIIVKCMVANIKFQGKQQKVGILNSTTMVEIIPPIPQIPKVQKLAFNLDCNLRSLPLRWPNLGCSVVLDDSDFGMSYLRHHPKMFKSEQFGFVSTLEFSDILPSHACIYIRCLPSKRFSDDRKLIVDGSFCRIVLSSSVPVGHVLLPDNIIKTCGIHDYDIIHCQFRALVEVVSVVPKVITFTPCCSNSQMHHEFSQALSITNGMLCDSITRYRNVHSRDSVFVLVDKSIVTLEFVDNQFKKQAIDFVVVIESTNDKNSNQISTFIMDGDDAFLVGLEKFQINHDFCNLSSSTSSSVIAAATSIKRRIGGNISTILLEPLYEASFRALVKDILFAFHPQYLLSMPSCFPSGLGCCVVGPRGSGKSTLLDRIIECCQETLMLPIAIERVDCQEWADLSLSQLLEKIDQKFSAVDDRCPSLLVLDNFDLLCPSLQGLAPSRHSDLTKFIQVTHVIKEWFVRWSERLNNSGEKNLPTSPSHSSHLSYWKRRVFVIVSSESEESISDEFYLPFLLRRKVSLDAVSNEILLQVLMKFLQQNKIDVLNDMSMVSKEQFLHALEGFRLIDVVHLFKRILVDVAVREIPDWTLQDILAMVSGHRPMFSGQSTKISSNSDSWHHFGGFPSAVNAIREFLQFPLAFQRLMKECHVKFPKGLLIFGPPGYGKSVLARIAAKECGWQLITIRGPELLNKYIGESEKAIRELFKSATASKRHTLLLFEELESICPRRGRDHTGVTDRVVNQLLTFLDGVESSSGTSMMMLIVATTSRPDLIDPALLRPGRIEKRIYLGEIDYADRMSIMIAHLSKFLSVENIASLNGCMKELINNQLCSHFSPADFKALVDSAYLEAIQDQIHEENHSCSKISDVQLNQSIKDNPSEANPPTKKIWMEDSHLWKALQGTRPALSLNDMQRFQSYYQLFDKRKTEDIEIQNTAMM